MAMSEQEWLDIFGDNLASILEYTNTSRKELAECTGLTEGTISKYINKLQMPGVRALVNIGIALNWDFNDLMDFGDTID